MTAHRLPFHIQQNTTPDVLGAILGAIVDNPSTMAMLSEILGLRVGTVQHIIPFIRQLGLMEPSRLLPTDLGLQCHRLLAASPSLLPEAIHHLLRTMHSFDPRQRFSWAYARVTDVLWARGGMQLDAGSVSGLVAGIVEDAAREFSVPTDQVAFSRDSILGVLNWLRALDPPVVERQNGVDVFRRRFFCPVPAFLWALDFLYRITETAWGVRIFLTPEHADRLCRACVLDPSGLDNVLMMAKRTSDYERGGIFDYGTDGGFGRWLLLASPCPVPELVG